MIIIKIIVVMNFIYVNTIYLSLNDSKFNQVIEIKETLKAQLEDSEKLLNYDRDKSYEIALKVLKIADSLGYIKEEARAKFIIGKIKSLSYLNIEAVNYFNDAIILFNKIEDKSSASECLYYLGTKNIEIGNYTVALSQLQTCLNYAGEIGDKKRIILINRSFGLYYYYENKFEMAIKYFKNCLKIAEAIKFKDYHSSLYYLIGYSYVALCIYDKSLEYAFLSLNIGIDNDDMHSIAMSYHLIAAVYYDLENYSRSLTYDIQSLNLKKKINDKFLIASSYTSIGLNYFNLTEYDSAFTYFQRGLELEKQINYKQGIALSLNYIGDVYYISGELEKAKMYYLNAFDLMNNINDKWGIAKISVNLGKMYNKVENNIKAKYFLKKGILVAKQVKAKDTLLNGYLIMSDYYKKTNNFERANFYLSEYISLKDITIIENTHRISEMQLRYETDRREKEKLILEKKIAIQNLQLQKNTLISWLLFLGLILVFSIVVFISVLYKSKIKSNHKLKQKVTTILENYKKQQQIIVHQASLTSLGEMTASISHEINQALQDIIFATESLKTGFKDNPLLDKGVREINADIDRIYNTVHHVRCFSSMQKDDINEAFSIKDSIVDAYNLIKRQMSKYNIEVGFNFDPDLDLCRGNRYKFEQVILNILSNSKDAIIQKYNLNEVNYKGIIAITTNQDKKFIITEICDNGTGIPTEQSDEIFRPFFTTKKVGNGTGLGLSIAKGIITEMGGSISFQSECGNKTIFKIKLPRNSLIRKEIVYEFNNLNS